MSFNTSSKPSLFKDLNKRLSDLLTKDFPLENKVEWKAETTNGITVETNLVQKNGAVIGTFSPKYKIKDYGVDISGELNTKKELKGEVSVIDQIAKGLKLFLIGNYKGEEHWVTTGTEFKADLGTFTASFDYGKESGSTIKSTATVGLNGFTLGASAEYFLGTDNSELKELNTILTYDHDDYALSAFGKLKSGSDEKNETGFSYFHHVNRDLSIGTEISLDHASADAKPKLLFGTQYKLQNDTILKGKFDTNGQLGLSFTQKFNQNAKLVVSASLDTNNLSGKNSSRVGFNLALNN